MYQQTILINGYDKGGRACYVKCCMCVLPAIHKRLNILIGTNGNVDIT